MLRLELQSDPALSQRRGVGWSGKDRSLRDADGVSVISQLESLCTTMTKRRRAWNGESCGCGMGMGEFEASWVAELVVVD